MTHTISTPTPVMPPAAPWWSAVLGRPVWNQRGFAAEQTELAQNPVTLADGNGRGVVIAPGFFNDERSSQPVAAWLAAAGYEPTIAAVQRNDRGSGWAAQRIEDAIIEVSDATGDSVIVIGHSRGGQQSRVAVNWAPERVAQLITLGSPVRHHLPRYLPLHVAARVLQWRADTGRGPAEDPELEARYVDTLFAEFSSDVAWTSVWSPIDGYVAPADCIDPAARSVSVQCTHSGLFESVPAFRVIAETIE